MLQNNDGKVFMLRSSRITSSILDTYAYIRELSRVALLAVVCLVVIVDRSESEGVGAEMLLTPFLQEVVSRRPIAGGFGVVNKAVRKGTEVAVKMMTADANTRELDRNFKEEVSSSMRNAPCVSYNVQ
nr:serine/threonine kinase [Pandoravirus massiliensis]